MKQFLFFLALTIAGSTNIATAAGCTSYQVTTAPDKCGKVLKFTVSCVSGCSCSDLGTAAANYVHSHTNNQGCYFL